MCTKGIALKAACADNFYYPPEWDPNSGKSLDQFQREKGFEHHLGANRVKNMNKGALLVRFELPFKVRCLRCKTTLGQGTRWDAEKKCIGHYHSTKIWQFTMRCRCPVGHERSADGRIYCNQQFVIKTNPETRAYDLVEGWEEVNVGDGADQTSAEGQRQWMENNKETSEKEQDAMFKLEKTIRNKEKEADDKVRLRALIHDQKEREDTYSLNSNLRKRMRTQKKEIAEQQRIEDSKNRNFVLPLLDENEEDKEEAATVAFKTDYDKMERIQKREDARNQPLFSSSSKPSLKALVDSGERGLKRKAPPSILGPGPSAMSTRASTSATTSTKTLLSISGGSIAPEQALSISGGRTAVDSRKQAAQSVADLVQKKRKLVMHQKMARLFNK
eukprot:gnl/MRDRNA2_/MRDRNA2_107570_c0_seq1.p1 gnl/MRDRNA2_/MRDRNA2_107570_c0~~gnl/MRDRNA2_/MRDRNA2_107570_c0_seq1.p1  ORF type:complete len:388 (-),score=88.68 gnl/MRDRNA2_/MRDRNA2_107570_c0_seq1:30-1193(-)